MEMEMEEMEMIKSWGNPDMVCQGKINSFLTDPDIIYIDSLFLNLVSISFRILEYVLILSYYN